MMKIAVAHSLELESSDAIKEVLEQCHEQLGDLIPRAGLLFAGIDHDHSLILNRINEMYPGIDLIGCTTDGELSSIHAFTEDSVNLVLFCSEELVFGTGVADGISKDTAANIRKTVDSAKVELEMDPVLCICTPSGLTASGDNIVEGFRESLGGNFPVFGGNAGDAWRIKETCQFHKNKVYTDAAPFMLIGGPILYSFGVESGWIPIGKRAVVTRSDNNIVYEIGNDTALEFFQHHLGKKLGEGEWSIMGDYPLAVFEEDSESFYLRAATTFDIETGSLTFVGNVPQGSNIQITHSTRDRIVEATKTSVKDSVTGYAGNKPAVALCFSCASRKQVLGTRVEEEYDAFNQYAPDLPVAGFYTYGEIGPLNRDKPTRFHNDTFFSLILGIE
jgi:hypothetical protein